MIKHLLLTLMLLLNSSIVLAQFDNISIIGQFTNWAADVPMATEDGVIYTLSSQNFAVSGGAKFRKDNMWDTNWGATTFPTGTATQGGQDIPVPMGTYDVEFNKETGTYIFTEVASEFDNIGIIGGFNSWAESEQMVTFDGSLYTLDDYYFSADEVKFRKDNNWDVNWGGSTFPSGEAIANGNNIPLVAGFYNVAFNYSGLNYSFIQVPVSLIGDGAQGWETDIALPSSDGGVTFLMQNFELVDGFVKFRANSSWGKNWGSADFPTGTGTQNGMDIPTVAGIYNISFNRITGEYNFEEVLSVNDPLKVSAKVYPNPTQN
ncbi:MAG: hypothetical protein KDC50_06395, partial [Flavobacterium sp.]|nr:hypothetical protein [Flavobacterium sp.]